MSPSGQRATNFALYLVEVRLSMALVQKFKRYIELQVKTLEQILIKRNLLFLLPKKIH
jgi:hypothetical protein